MTDVRADAQSTIALTAQVTAFLWTGFRAGAQTPTELTAALTTFIKNDDRADAPANSQLTAHVSHHIHVYLRSCPLNYIRED